ncbi:Glutathione S-transferase, C-terminal domain [Tilletia horrida]|uniref:Glutathione S-transferase, C-terminal domain n=1 Tax=Tilletia horrida TaxID=155126 RepID=A0AAN6JRL4_9BASI|nr:Glutathione S-transferase, C-terminal domain [Tilletia horrida]
MSTSGPLKLYSWPESGNSYKVRLLASLLKIELEVQDLDFLKQEQKQDWFLKINPKGEVPTLVLPSGKILNDSAAILTYLAGKVAPESCYWSQDVEEQAEIVQWLAFAASWVQFGVFTARAILSYGGAYNGLGTAQDTHLLEEAKIRGHKSLRILNDTLAQQDWLALGRITIADIAVFVYVALAPMGDILLDGYEHVRAWIERIKGLSGFITIPGLDDPLIRRRHAQ